MEADENSESDNVSYYYEVSEEQTEEDVSPDFVKNYKKSLK
jgi:hypothetical protein